MNLPSNNAPPSNTEASGSSTTSQPSSPTSAEIATRKLLATLWQRNLPVLLDRLAELDKAAEDAVWQTLTSQAREDAAMTAHKLAGSLGMFGYPQGTELARKIEQMLTHWDVIDGAELRELTVALRSSLNL